MPNKFISRGSFFGDIFRLKIQSFRLNFSRKCSGFTLVELLVVLGLLSITVGATLLFLTSTLKGSNSAAITAEVKQNGQSVLDSLERQIRGSMDAQRINSKLIVLTKQNGELLHLQCFDPTPGDQNGWIGSATFSAVNPGGSSVGYTALTNNSDPVAGISVSSCDLDVSEPALGSASPKVVSIEFVMNQGEQAPSRVDFLANTKFQTTISLR